MANDLTGNPWIIDTVMATPYKDNTRISNAVWTEQTAAGDQLVILDRTGRVILDIKAQAANNVQPVGNFGWIEGMRVSVLTSGKLYLYLHKG